MYSVEVRNAQGQFMAIMVFDDYDAAHDIIRLLPADMTSRVLVDTL